MGIIIGLILVVIIIWLIIAGLAILAIGLGVGLLIGGLVAYFKSVITYIASVNENTENIVMRIFMIAVTVIIALGPMLTLVLGFLTSGF